MYDTASNELITVFDAGGGTLAIKFSSDGQRAYLANTLDDHMTVIDTETFAIIATVDLGASSYPFDLELSPDGSRVYVSLNLAADVAIVDTATLTISSVINLGTFASVGELALSPDGQRLFITFINHDAMPPSLVVIDTTTEQVIASLPLTSNPNETPRTLKFSPDGQRLFLGVRDSGIWIFDPATLQLVDTIELVGFRPQSFAVHPDQRRLYALAADRIHIFDLATLAETGTLDFSGRQMAFGPPPAPVNPLPIPTLNPWALLLLSGVLALLAVHRLNRVA